MCFWSFFQNAGSELCFRIFFPIKGKWKLYHIETQTDVINWSQICPPPPPTYSKSEYGLAILARAFAVQKNHLCLLLRKRLLKSGSISLLWVRLCLRNLDAVFMQSRSFVVLNSLQLEGCAFNDIRWLQMPLFTSLLVSHKRSSPLAAHFCESCRFLFVFSFSYVLPFFSALLFHWRLIAA